LQQGHARLTAYAAHRKKDAALARRAWDEFYAGRAGFAPNQKFEAQRIQGSAVLNSVDEAAWVSTNSAAQWGLAAIECLAFASSMADHTRASTLSFSGEHRARD
jgi:PcRGLX-like protein C-terminal alpha/alpha toroid domain